MTMGLTFYPSSTNSWNAFANKRRTGNFHIQNAYTFWTTKEGWAQLTLTMGIRRSDKLQWFPIWIENSGNFRRITVGFWKFYIGLDQWKYKKKS